MLFNSALLLCLIHGYRYSPPRYLVTVYPLSLSASFNRAYTYIYGLSSCCPTLQILSIHRCPTVSRRFRPSSASSQSLKLSSRSHPAAVHLRRRPLHPRHESASSLTGVRPLERAYCHESARYISYTS